MHSISGLMLNPYGCLGDLCPRAVFITELRVHIRCFFERGTAVTILFQEQCQVGIRLYKFCMDQEIVGFQPCGRCNEPSLKQGFAQHFVGDGLIQRLLSMLFTGGFLDIADNLMRTVYAGFNLPLAPAFACETENFTVIWNTWHFCASLVDNVTLVYDTILPWTSPAWLTS